LSPVLGGLFGDRVSHDAQDTSLVAIGVINILVWIV
jgi:hypothetical protein